MKALHVIAGVAPRYGGPSQAIVGMTRALREHGVETLIATTDADGAGHLSVPLGVQTTYSGVPVIFFSRQWSESLKVSFPLAGWLHTHIGEFDAVHIHAVFSHAAIAAAAASRARNIPYVVRPLGNLDPWSMSQNPLRKQVFWYVCVKQMMRQAAAVHYTTSEEKRLAETSLGIGRGVVIPLGLDDSLFTTPRADEQFRKQHPVLGAAPYILVLSRLHPKKGLDLFIDVFLEATSASDLRQWHMVVAGDGEADYVNGLKRRVHELAGDDRVLFTGWLGGAEKLAAFDGASLMALPSKQENFGISVAEAMARGVPVLVSPHVNLAPEIEAANAGWVAALTPNDLAEGLQAALRDPEQRARRGEAGGRLTRERFSWQRLAADLSQLYTSIQPEVRNAVAARVLP